MHARRSSRPRPDHVIDGRAVVIERRPAAPSRPVVPMPSGILASDIRPINDNGAGMAPFTRARPATPDLVFQGNTRWSQRSAAPRRPEGRHHATVTPAPQNDAERQKASVGVMIAVVAALAGWSAPELHPPAAPTVAPAHSTHGVHSSTKQMIGTVSGSGKSDRTVSGSGKGDRIKTGK